MPTSQLWRRFAAAALFVLTVPGWAVAQRPHATLMPDTTQGFVAIPDVPALRASWSKTQFGQLTRDPVMKPFIDELRAQIENRFSNLHSRLELTLDDLEGVPGGEVSLALIRPAPEQAATALLMDVTGHMDRAAALLQKIDANLTRERATKQQRQAYGARMTVYTVPPGEGQTQPRTAVFFLAQNTLGATDSLPVAEGILGRMAGQLKNSLAGKAAFAAIIHRVGQSLPDLKPEIRWYVNPFGYAETMRIVEARNPRRRARKRSQDMLKILAHQGFKAIQGVGGFVNFYVNGRYEMLHRTAIYAPPVPGAPPDERYTLAARMLQFPNGGSLDPQPWVPRDLATYVSFNWKTRKAFEHSKTLVDEIVGEKGVFEDVIASIQSDPNGPQINLRTDLIAHLGERVTMISDYTLPITPKSERIVFAVKATDPAALAKTIEKTMKSDPDAHLVQFGKHAIWEIVERPAGKNQPPELQFDGFDQIDTGAVIVQPKRKLPNSAVAVANGQLYVATHIDFLKKVLTPREPRETLAEAFDYKLVMSELNQVLPVPTSFRAFARTEEAYRPTYELIRTGRMPEAQTMLGKLLNALLGGNLEEGELRQQKIHGEKLPEFERVRRYFGPAGTSVVSENTGWFLLGITLGKK